MANKTFPRGLIPVTRNGQSPDTVSYPKSTSSATAIWVGSPVQVSSGQVRSVVTDADGLTMTNANHGVTGAVVALLNSSGAVVDTLAAGDAGTVILTYLENQVYRCCISTTAYAAADAGNKYYNFTAETSTQITGSGRKLDGATEASQAAASDGSTASGVMLAGTRVEPCAAGINDVATADTEVYCTIASVFHTPAV